MEALGVAANVIAVIDISVKILQVCSQYAKEVKDARDDIEQFREEVADLQSVTKEVHRLINSPGGTKLRTPQSFAETIESSESLLSELCDRLEPAPKGKMMRRIGLRSLKWPFQSKEIERIIERIKRCSDSISLALQVDQTTVLLDVDSKLDKVDSQSIMRVLPSAAGAAYNSYAEEHNSTCLKNTRLELLQEIHDWIDNHQAQTIFWLNGMAGTGKSTIARTMASKWDKRGYLGASFFFKRGEADRGNLSRFYTTVARQLVVSTPGLAPHVKAAIEKDDSITTKAAAEQFDKLILQPLLQVQVTDKTVIAVTIDALDECEGDQEIRQLIDLLTRTRDVLDPRIRVLITSRPELPIRLGFNAIPGHYQDFVLHDIPESIITRDILVFLEEKLGDIRRTYNASVDEGRKLADDWPGMASTELLAQRATPLFIFAATVCRFISQRNCANPQKQLQKVLSYETKSQESKMDATYLPPLEQQLEELSKREQEEVVNEFQQIVGTLVLLESPLSVSALARLIDTSEQTIYGRLDMLHSVLKFPTTSETPIRLLHLSFRDFLLDPEKQGVNKFWVDKKQAHGRIAMGCLRVMDACLKEDICGLIVPGIERSEISPERVMSCISVELQYACRYWTFHVQEAESFAQAEEEILSFLKRHLLHWLEVLSLLGRSRESFRAIRILQTLAKDGPNKKLSDLSQDTHRFIQTNSVIIELYPLQLYSLLYYVPTTSILSSLFAKEKPKWVSQLPDPDSAWDQRQLILENNQSWEAGCLAMDDSRLVCISCDGTIRIWRLDTGECIREMQRQVDPWGTKLQCSIKLCHNLMVITCIERDKGDQLSLHCADTGALIERYDLSSDYSKSIEISSDSEYLAFTKSKDTVILLHLGTMNRPRQIYLNDSSSICDRILGPSDLPMPRLEYHLPYEIPMPRVVFSMDSKFVAVISSSTGKYAIWDLETLDCIRQHHDPSESVLEMYDSDGDLLPMSFALTKELSILMAWAGDDQLLRIEWLDSGEIILEAEDNSDGGGIYTQFSPDHTMVASISRNGRVKTWRIDTGECLSSSKFKHSRFLTTISPGFDLVASQETFNTIIVERTESDGKSAPESAIISLVLSPDHKLVASAAIEGIYKLWDVLTGNCTHGLGYSGSTSFMQFSSNSRNMLSFNPYLAGTDIEVKIWDTNAGKCLVHHWAARATLEDDDPFVQFLPGPEGAISPDDQWIVSSRNKRILTWGFGAVSPYPKLAFRSEVYDAMFSPDSRLVVILSLGSNFHNRNDTSEDNEPTANSCVVSVESTEKACCVATVRCSNHAVSILAISPDSKLIAMCMAEGNTRWIQVLRTDTGEEVCKFVCRFPTRRSGTFIRNSTALAWRENSTLVFIDITNGTLIQRLEIDFPYRFQRLDFQPENHHIYTNFGTISFDRPIIEEEGGVVSFHEHRSGCGISSDQSWLLWNKTKILWLPPAFRPSNNCVEVSGSTVFIGTKTRGVVCFKLDIEKMSDVIQNANKLENKA